MDTSFKMITKNLNTLTEFYNHEILNYIDFWP